MTTSTTNGVRAVKWLLAAAACLAAITSGCVIPPAQQRYVIIAQPMQPQRPQWQTIAPAPAPTVKTVKTVQPVKSAKSGMGGSSFSAPKAAKAEEVRSGDLDDVLARIHAHRQEKEGETRNDFLIRYVLTHPGITAGATGTRSTEHLAQNVRAAERGPLSDEVYAEAKRRLAYVGCIPGPTEIGASR